MTEVVKTPLIVGRNRGLVHTIARTKNPQGKPILRVSLANGKTVSSIIRIEEGQTEEHINHTHLKATMDSIAEKIQKDHPDFADGISEELHARLELKGQRNVGKPATEPKEKKPKKDKATKNEPSSEPAEAS